MPLTCRLRKNTIYFLMFEIDSIGYSLAILILVTWESKCRFCISGKWLDSENKQSPFQRSLARIKESARNFLLVFCKIFTRYHQVDGLYRLVQNISCKAFSTSRVIDVEINRF